MQILTRHGFKPFTHVIHKGKEETLTLTFNDGKQLTCTLNHKIYLDSDNEFIPAAFLETGDIVSGKEIVEISTNKDKHDVYDVFDVEDVHEYQVVDNVTVSNCNMILLDEFAHVPNAEDFYESTYPVVSSSQKSKIIIISTPKGMNLFYKLWKGAEKGTNAYKQFFAPYWEHPDRDESWAERERGNMSEQRFNQEFLCEFIGSSATLINTKTLKSLEPSKPIETDGQELKYFKLPFAGHRYVITVDTGEGTTRDYSVANVIDVTESPSKESGKVALYEQVAIYKSNTILPETFAQIVLQLAYRYNNAFIMPENNSIGKIVADTIHHDFEYENIFTSVTKAGETTVREGASRYAVGLRQTAKTKSVGCSRLKSILESGLLELSDDDTIAELFSFVKEGNTYKAEEGKHDDCAMTLVMFAWLTQTETFKELTGIIDKTLRDKLLERDTLPVSLFNASNSLSAGDSWAFNQTSTEGGISVVKNSSSLLSAMFK